MVISLITFAASNANKTGKKGLLIVFEDSQWLDTSSLQVLEVIMERISADSKIFPSTCILVSGRTNVTSDDATAVASMPGGKKDMRKLLEGRVLESLVEIKVWLFDFFFFYKMPRIPSNHLCDIWELKKKAPLGH